MREAFQDQVNPSAFAASFRSVVENIERVIVGKTEVIELAAVCLFAQGHLLIEDVPGVGKTAMARCIAHSIASDWKRIQFTPDLLPSDITGVTWYNQRTGDFTFRPGPIFANIVLCDEVNRASPKTQSALLEVMEERQVTEEGHPRLVPRPFMVVATQNPLDMDGTFPLPEAQLDRFLLRLGVGYPDETAEMSILQRELDGRFDEDLSPVLHSADVLRMAQTARRVSVAESVKRYVVHITARTRRMPELRLGVSPRGGIALMKAAQVWAAANERTFVTADDIRHMAVPVLSHRVRLSADLELQATVSTDTVIENVLLSVDAPRDRER
ncbi:AAA family ATPase [Actinoplanes rectilineatus]|uniref:AAA family ATPase n=1 Tax=Actinoplanes rectilineatus TaxID=113571 RepID=UPI0005F2F20B|nr:MoxR family ATPase [Actinoplanes rectilineatus]